MIREAEVQGCACWAAWVSGGVSAYLTDRSATTVLCEWPLPFLREKFFHQRWTFVVRDLVSFHIQNFCLRPSLPTFAPSNFCWSLLFNSFEMRYCTGRSRRPRRRFGFQVVWKSILPDRSAARNCQQLSTWPTNSKAHTRFSWVVGQATVLQYMEASQESSGEESWTALETHVKKARSFANEPIHIGRQLPDSRRG